MSNHKHPQDHTPGTWRNVEIGDDGDYTQQIETTGGRIASIVAWSRTGTMCETTAGNARLIEHAPDMAEALRDLLAWSAFCGPWDAPCWTRADSVLRHATGRTDPQSPSLGLSARTLLEQAVPASEAWNDHTTLSVLLDFLDAEVIGDPVLRKQLAEHLREAVAG